ncbi:DUF1178 family protein [Thioclava atlantica]|uniref:DUF1178 family protein n=1 Tax=Thioclava atlantica TaxID=1317124 RepID=A0A085TY05_9RHOB|nr:DUF1178 family protein [Thioclava atlantica]KFE35602.1 hypothetical protein DW2_06558 [Thioclava atlantica]
MIRYTLKCDQGHSFESWFSSADGFEALRSAGQLDCATCGSRKVEKTLMAPSVAPGRKKADAPAASEPERPLAAPRNEAEAALAAMRRHIEENSDYVGMNFATEARAIHEGEKPARAIHGEAKLDEARAMIEDGIAVTPLPFLPKRKTN